MRDPVGPRTKAFLKAELEFLYDADVDPKDAALALVKSQDTIAYRAAELQDVAAAAGYEVLDWQARWWARASRWMEHRESRDG